MARLASVRVGVLGFAVLLVALTACGARGEPAGQHPNDARPGTVSVEISSFYIQPDVHTIHTGPITFEATNKDVITHEMLVVRVADFEPGDGSAQVSSTKGSAKAVIEAATQDRLVAQLNASAYDHATSRLAEERINSIGEVADLEGQTQGTVTLDLPPGQYLLLCNITAHFQSGMHSTLIVTP